MKFQAALGYLAGVATVLLVWYAVSGHERYGLDAESRHGSQAVHDREAAGAVSDEKHEEDAGSTEQAAALAVAVEAAPAEPASMGEQRVSENPGAEAVGTSLEPMELGSFGVSSTTEQTSIAQAKKHYFWSAFSLQARAKRFAELITRQSGVDCLAEKSGVGKYMVYFTYTDTGDREFKLSQISTIGIIVE